MTEIPETDSQMQSVYLTAPVPSEVFTTTLPCPFCGGAPEFENTDERARLRCIDCGAEGGLFFYSQEECDAGIGDETEARAIAAWNRRAPHHRSADTERHGSDKPESEPDSSSSIAAQGMAQDAARSALEIVDEAQCDPGCSPEYRKGYFDAYNEVRAALRAVPHQPTGARNGE